MAIAVTLNPVKGRGPHGALRPQPSTTLRLLASAVALNRKAPEGWRPSSPSSVAELLRRVDTPGRSARRAGADTARTAG
jgi:hypothetical protein